MNIERPPFDFAQHFPHLPEVPRPEEALPYSGPALEAFLRGLHAADVEAGRWTSEQVDALVSSALASPWLDRVEKNRHDLFACSCVGCRSWRGEPSPPPPKRARMRSFWLADELYGRLGRLSTVTGRSVSELCRKALREFLQVEEAQAGLSTSSRRREVQP